MEGREEGGVIGAMVVRVVNHVSASLVVMVGMVIVVSELVDFFDILTMLKTSIRVTSSFPVVLMCDIRIGCEMRKGARWLRRCLGVE